MMFKTKTVRNKNRLMCGLAGSLVLLTLTACQKPEAALSEENAPQETEALETAGPVKVIGTPRPPQSAPKQTIKSQPTIVQAKPVKENLTKATSRRKVERTPFNVRRCMNLGNALEAESEGAWGYTIRKKDLQTIAAAGFDTVRIPVRWDLQTGRRAPYTINPAYMARVQQVIRQAQQARLGVILDVHHYEKLMGRTDYEETRFLSIWDQIATTFAGASDRVHFEVLNEPTNEISTRRLNALYSKVIPIIRRTNPTRKIIIGGNSWNAVDTLDSVSWPADPNIVATFHDYGPHEFTHQGAEWMDPAMPMGRIWGSKKDIASLQKDYTMAVNFRNRTGIPILVGEFGVIDKVPQQRRNQWVKARRKSMENAGFAWCAWDFSGAFKNYDVQNERWFPGALDALVGQ